MHQTFSYNNFQESVYSLPHDFYENLTYKETHDNYDTALFFLYFSQYV